MKLFAGLAIVPALVATVLAAPSSSPSPTPTFKAGVELVRLDVQATDRNGRPVPDLRQDEVQVFEGGRRLPVLFFQHVKAPTESYVESARHTIAGEVSTNQGAPRGHLYVLVFDQDHITPGREQKVRQAADRFLRTRLKPGDRVAIYGLPGPGPDLGFSGDVALAEHALASVRGGLNRVGLSGLGSIDIDEAYQIVRGNELVLQRVVSGLSEAQGNGIVLADVPHQGSDDLSNFRQLVREEAETIVAQADDRDRQFLGSLGSLLRAMRPIEGRKTILLFSEGFYADHVSRDLEQVSAAAAQSYSVVYAMDLNDRAVDPSRSTPRGGGQAVETQDRLAPIASLALATSGRLVNDAAAWLDRSLNAIATASDDYYLVGFEPSRDDIRHRDDYHQVSVRVSRPGVHVSTRTGYALAPPATPADRRRAIDIALSAPFPEQALPIDYTTYELRGSSPDMVRVVLSVSAELPLTSAAGGTADVVFVVRRANDGRVAASGTDTIALPTAAAPGATTGTGAYRVQFEIEPGDYLMRVIVHEPGGMVGSADRRFTVRDIGGPGVSAGDLLLGAARTGQLPARIRAYTDDVLAGTVPLYARAPQQLQDASVTFTLTPLVGNTAAAVTLKGRASDVQQEKGGPERDVEFEMPLSGTPPGSYMARAIIRAGGEAVGELERQVTVLPGQAPPAALDGGSAASQEPPHEASAVLDGEVASDYLSEIATSAPEGSPLARAAALAARGDWPGVEKTLGPEQAQPSAAVLGLHGLALVARHDYAAAAEALRGALKLAPRDAKAAFLLGWADFGAGGKTRAIGDWRNAAVLDPSLVPAHLALADAYLALANRALAIQALQAGLRSVPQSPALQAKLAAIEHRP